MHVNCDCSASGQKCLNKFEDQTSLRLKDIEHKTVVYKLNKLYNLIILLSIFSGCCAREARMWQASKRGLYWTMKYQNIWCLKWSEEKKNQTRLKYWNLLQQLPSLTTAHLLIDAAHEHTGNSRSGLILGVT